jgi:hypothetical protein
MMKVVPRVQKRLKTIGLDSMMNQTEKKHLVQDRHIYTHLCEDLQATILHVCIANNTLRLHHILFTKSRTIRMKTAAL